MNSKYYIDYIVINLNKLKLEIPIKFALKYHCVVSFSKVKTFDELSTMEITYVV